ncbi:conserved Hypothetical protein [Psychrobacter arcticus 273-4]|uniref:DUF1365 domain-containing protein n=1 Tax=Psychrobacter arcticus (strain DSM 17307 / VKM B-2377 / 273-4) TaxID=259536 RepID=Q4FTR4_PSYA2|nr:DUF1365 family protein [Psychrobacter arcticus]AAZ18594.1 conserved Hypothetical protein [Psychrobacter arcticus 273-4]
MTASAQSKSIQAKHTLSDDAKGLPHQIFHGTTWHSRLLPSMHKFAYPYRYWGVNITALAAGQVLPEVDIRPFIDNKFLKKLSLNKLLLFSGTKKALQQFYPEDYLQGLSTQDKNSLSKNKEIDDKKKYLTDVQAIEQRLIQAFTERTGSAPTGDMIGMLVCRNAGIYFSPVNFYLGFDIEQKPSHLLAEVSNTPWDKRHYYGFLLDGVNTDFCHDKDFHVSPFNPIDQQYQWQVTIKSAIKNTVINEVRFERNEHSNQCLDVRIAINISDKRGEVLKTGIKMSGIPMTASTIYESLRKNPLMNVTSLMRIYGHAFKLYAIKKVPYINYDETLADSQQHNGNNSEH